MPLVVEAYGVGAAPLLRTAVNNAINIGGSFGNASNDGGYSIRNLRLDGMGSAEWGVWLVQNVRNVTLDNLDISGFKVGVHSTRGAPYGVTSLAIRNCRVSRNIEMGLLGSFSDSVIEGNHFEGNNFSGSGLNHAIYFSDGSRTAIRNNTFNANSTVAGVCRGGNVTVHGVVDTLLIEGNTITQSAAVDTCYGFAVTAGYTTFEEFRNVVIRGNTIVNVGFIAIAANAAPGILVENNRIINTQATTQLGVSIPANGGANPGDAADRDAIVRGNTVCFASPQNSTAIYVSGMGVQVSNNTVVVGPDALTGNCVP